MNDMWTLGRRARRFLFVAELLGALVVTALSLGVTSTRGSSWWGLPATLLLFCAFVLRRRSLPWTCVLATAAGILQLINVRGFIFFADLLYAPICFRFGISRDPKTRRWGLIAAILACVIPGATVIPRWTLPQPQPPSIPALIGVSLMFTGFAALVSIGGWTWGYLRLQQRLRVEAALATQLSEAERIRLEETYAQSAFRERIASEMHDVVGHSWAVVAAQAAGARYALRTSPERAEQALDTIADIARSSITDLRDILRELRYTETAEGQIGAAQQDELLRRMRQTGMDVQFEEIGDPSDSAALRQTSYRLLSESLTNALKHGDMGHPVTARLDWTDGFTLEVTNHIGGTSRIPGTGMGIGSMRERARVLGGSLEAREDRGLWRLRAHIPAPSPQETS